MTSNLGAEILVSENASPGSSNKDDNEISPSAKKAVMDVVAASYPPEFLNRIDEFIIFRRLSRTALRDIVDIRLRELQARLDDRRITLRVPGEIKDWLCESGYDPRFGARPLNRLIAKEIGNGLAAKIIRGEIKSGNTVGVAINAAGDHLEVSSSQ